MMKQRKICVVTGTRAEYGLLRWVMEEIWESASLELQVIATGMHLSPEFGLTYRDIEADGFRIDRKSLIVAMWIRSLGLRVRNTTIKRLGTYLSPMRFDEMAS